MRRWGLNGGEREQRVGERGERAGWERKGEESEEEGGGESGVGGGMDLENLLSL